MNAVKQQAQMHDQQQCTMYICGQGQATQGKKERTPTLILSHILLILEGKTTLHS
jgi:hypothetical protein